MNRLFALLLALLPTIAAAQNQTAAPPAKKRPHTDSRAPFVHRIPLRDDQDLVIGLPKHDAPPPAAGTEKKEVRIPLASVQMTCGKCHDYPAINVGWHFNAADPNVHPGRPGEPWILTDDGVLEDLKNGQANTRTQLPLSYRNWPGTWRPADVGLNDWKFAYAFGRHHPGGGVLETSKDQRFNVTGVLQNDCMVCHVNDNSYDLQARYDQIVKKQNFKYATLVASGVGVAEKSREKLKDEWLAPDRNDPKASGPSEPPFEYDLGRFNPLGQILFNLSRRVSNDACYQCHTSLDTGQAGTNDLGQRWNHDRDIHLVKGMLCVDCHKHGLDHMITRGYEGEEKHRADKNTAVTTLTCAGCHYGAGGPEGVSATGPTNNAGPAGNTDSAMTSANDLGGRNAAPRPIHKGLPTLHFEKLSCTACHSGPFPSLEATSVLTSLAHRLGVESFNRNDDAAPAIQQPVFLRDPDTGKIAPHKMMFPTFWGRLNGDTVSPIAPDMLNASSTLRKLFGPKPTNDLQAPKAFTEDEIVKILDAIAAMEPSKITAATTKPATTQATTGAATQASSPWFTGEPIFVTGGKAFKRDGRGKLTAFDHAAAKPYAWALAHDVRGAQQSLGARGCTDCHAPNAPLFDSTISSKALLASANTTTSMVKLRGDSMGALAAFAATYPMRPVLIATGYGCAAILALVLIAYAGRAVGGLARRRF